MFRLALLLGVACVAAVVLPVWLIHRASGQRIYDGLANVPVNDVGLVLGTSRSTRLGHGVNPHFSHRMEAAAALFHAGKVRHLLLSGDNGSRGYDEPADMKRALLALGVPAGAMTLDDAGFRTLDSVVRAKEIFGQKQLTIVTDGFHSFRAVFLARHFGIDAVGFPSREVEMRSSAKSRLRELLADAKACLDVYVLHTRPKFLGDPIAVRVADR